MLRGFVVVLVLGCGSKEAPAPPPAGSGSSPVPIDAGDGVTRREVVCAPNDAKVTLGAFEDHAAACWDGRCIDVHSEQRVVTPGPRPAAWLKKAEVTVDKVCFEGACTKTGAKLAAELEGKMEVAATFDRKAVVIGTRVWSVANDREIALVPPKAIFGAAPKDAIARQVVVAGNHLVVVWGGTDCPDPKQDMHPACGHYGQLVDSSGVNRGDELHAFEWPDVVQLGDVFVVVGHGLPQIAAFEVGSARPISNLGYLFGVAFDMTDTIRVRDDAFVVLVRESAGWSLVEFNVGPKHPLQLLYWHQLPFCR